MIYMPTGSKKPLTLLNKEKYNMNARVIFSKDFQEKMNKPLTSFDIGKLRWKRIEELEENGKLGEIRNRYELCLAVGMTPEQAKVAGASYASNLVRRKHLRESVVGLVDGKMTYKYSIIKAPTFGRHRKRGRKTKNTIPDYPKQTQFLNITEPTEGQTYEAKALQEEVKVVAEAKPQIIVRYGKVELEFNAASVLYVVELVKKLNEE